MTKRGDTCWCGYETADRLGSDGRLWGPSCRQFCADGFTFEPIPKRPAMRPSPRLDAPIPYVGHDHPETAQMMQAKAVLSAGAFRTKIAGAIASAVDGLTDYEMEDAGLGEHQSVSGARRSLVLSGHIEVATNPDGSIRTRVNRNGNPAQVWVATIRAREELARLG